MTTYSEVLERPGVNLVEFYASWCPHCHRMMPIVEEVRELVAGKADVFQFDIDQFPSDAEAAGASSVPTFIIYRDGQEVWRQVGEMPGEELLKAVQAAC